MYHDLKTDSHIFQAVYDGKKIFDVRKNDRDYQVGDELRLLEGDIGREDAVAFRLGEAAFKLTGRFIWVRVTYVLKGPMYGIPEGWVVMSIKKF